MTFVPFLNFDFLCSFASTLSMGLFNKKSSSNLDATSERADESISSSPSKPVIFVNSGTEDEIQAVISSSAINRNHSVSNAITEGQGVFGNAAGSNPELLIDVEKEKEEKPSGLSSWIKPLTRLGKESNEENQNEAFGPLAGLSVISTAVAPDLNLQQSLEEERKRHSDQMANQNLPVKSVFSHFSFARPSTDSVIC